MNKIASFSKILSFTDSFNTKDIYFSPSYLISNLNEKLIKFFIISKLTPLLYYTIHRLNLTRNFSSSDLIKLKQRYLYNLGKNLKLWYEFLQINSTFFENKIPLIPFKGIILMHELYPSIGLREISDIDILIKEKDISSAKKILFELNYKNITRGLSESYRRKYHCHLSFYNYKKNISLELHWTFAPPRPMKIDLEEVWQRASLKEIDKVYILSLSPEDNLLSLIINISRNIPNLQYLPPKNIVDIHYLIHQQKNTLDWDYLLKKTLAWNLKGAFYYICHITKLYLHTPWPKGFINRIYIPEWQRKFLSYFLFDFRKKSQLKAIILMSFMLDKHQERLILIYKLILQAISIFYQNKRLFKKYLKR